MRNIRPRLKRNYFIDIEHRPYGSLMLLSPRKFYLDKIPSSFYSFENNNRIFIGSINNKTIMQDLEIEPYDTRWFTNDHLHYTDYYSVTQEQLLEIKEHLL